MSRLDRHVRLVQGKLAFITFLRALAWSLLAFGAVVWLFILLAKFFQVHLPRQVAFFWSGMGVAVVAAAVYALARRPTPKEAAVAIDERLGLKEKFSTALYVRPSQDPFAMAAVRDAERTADSVDLHNRFPVRLPRAFAGTAAVAVAAFLTLWLVPTVDLFGREEARQKEVQAKVQQDTARQKVADAIAKIDAAPKAAADKEEMKLARKDLAEMLKQPAIKDPAKASRTAERAIEDLKAVENKIKGLQDYASNQKQMKEFEQLAKQPIDESTPVGKAQAELAKGNISAAIDNLDNAVKNFDQMSKPDQEKAAAQMQKMAAQLQQMANDKNVQQQMQKQLQQMGASQQMAQQMTQQMQKAANGDKQAQQQLNQMTNQLLQQMANSGQGLTQQQIAAVRQQVQQMQGQANNQAQAQQLAQAAQQMAQAMNQAAGKGQQQQQPGQSGGQKTAQQNGGNNPQNQQNGNQPGGGQQNAQQQMAQAQQQMQQQLQQMQAMNADAQAMAAAQQGAGGPDGQNPGGGEGEQGQANGQGQAPDELLGDPNGKFGNGGQGGPGQATGQRPKGQSAPFGVKQEITKYQTDDKGKILASSFVKADPIKGQSVVGLSSAIAAAENEATDEIEEERVSKQARQAVKEYFDTLKQDSK
jgi:hypothetical protein